VVTLAISGGGGGWGGVERGVYTRCRTCEVGLAPARRVLPHPSFSDWFAGGFFLLLFLMWLSFSAMLCLLMLSLVAVGDNKVVFFGGLGREE